MGQWCQQTFDCHRHGLSAHAASYFGHQFFALICGILVVGSDLAGSGRGVALQGDNNAATATTTNYHLLVMLFLHAHKYGYAIALVFFGVSMWLLGVVIWTSRIFPRWLGAATSLAGLGYLVDSFSYFAVAGYTGDGIANNLCMLPVFVAEFGLAGWFLFRKPVPVHS